MYIHTHAFIMNARGRTYANTQHRFHEVQMLAVQHIIPTAGEGDSALILVSE